MMVNARTRNPWKARLESTEGLTSSARDGKGEAEVQEAQVPSVVMSRKQSWSRKRKVGEVLGEQESAARETVTILKDVQDCARGKSSSVHDRSSVTVAPAQQQARRRGTYGAIERTRDIEVGSPAENNISADIAGREAVIRCEEKNSKRKVLGHKVRKHGKEKVGGVVSNRSRELNPNRKRRNLLHGLGAVSEDIVNLAGPLTRGMIKPGTDGQTGTAHVKKRKRFRPEVKAGAPIIAEGESAGAEVLLLPGEESSKRPNTDLPINGSNVESSNKTAELDRDLGMKAIPPLEIPAGVSGLIHVPLQAEAQLSKPGRLQKFGKSISEVHSVKENIDRLPKPISPRVTRGMKDTSSQPAEVTNCSPPSKGDPESGVSIDEPHDQVVEPTTAVECPTMQLRNRKKVGESLNSAEPPSKRVKKKQDKLPADNCQKVVGMMKASDSVSKNRTANGTEGLGVINAATSDSQVNHSGCERNGNSLLNKEEDNGGGAQLSFSEGLHTNERKMDNPSGIGLQVDPGVLSTVSGLAVQWIKGVEKKNDKDTSHTKDCTEGDGRKGGRLGRMKKREKKKIDPGGGDSVQENTASGPHKNVLQHRKTRNCKMTKEYPQVGPGPSNESQPELGNQGVETQNLKGMTSEAADKSQKPAELAEIWEKTEVQKYVHLAETDRGCPEIDHHHASKTLPDESSNGEENKLDTVASREGPPERVRVLTRGREADGRISIGPANSSIKKKFKTKGNVGRLGKGRKEAEKSQKPAELAEIGEKGVQKYVRLAETDGGCPEIDHHHGASKTLLDESSNGEENKLDTVAPREGPPEPVRLLTRGREADGRISIGPANSSIKKKFKSKGNVGRQGKGRKEAEKSQKPAELAEIGEKTGVQKYVRFAETDGGCPEIDHHHGASKTLLDESSNGEENKLDTVAPRKGPPEPVRVLTRGREADGRKSIGPANGSIKKKFKTKGNVGRQGKGRKEAEKSQKPAELAEIGEKGVQKYVRFAETDGGCPEIDHHHGASKTLLDESSNGEENKLDTVAPREGPPDPVRVLTRGREADGRKSIDPANGSIKKKFKTKGNVGRQERGRKEADARVLLQIPKTLLEKRKVGSPTGAGETPDQGEHCLCNSKRNLPEELSARKDCNVCRSKMVSSTIVAEDDSIFKETSEEVNLNDSAYQHEVTADIVQLEHRAEPLNVVVEVTQKSLQINPELESQSAEAQGGPDSVQVPVKKKKVWRRRDYGCGSAFQRITRARDSTGKTVSDIESQDDKNDRVADAVIGEHPEIRAEGVVFTTENSKDSPRLEQVNAEQEDSEQVKSLLDVSYLLDKSVRCSPEEDKSGATIELGKEAVKVTEALKSVVIEPAGTGALVVRETENSDEPASISSPVLKHFEESKTAAQGELNGEQDDQPASSAVSLLDCQKKNIEVPELFSKHPDSPDGPFSLDDGKSLTLHCGQEKASNLDDGHSPYFEKICAQDFNRSGAALGAYSIRAPDQSESLIVVKTSDPVASADKSDPDGTIVKSELVGTMVESSSVVTSVESDPCATIGGLDPVASIVESDPVAAIVESDRIAAIVESDPVAGVSQSCPVAGIVASDPVAAIVESDPVAAIVDSDPVAATVESDPVAAIVESNPVATTIVSDPVAFTVESDFVRTMVDSDPGANVIESDSFYAAEGVNPITTSDSSNVDMQNSITIENMFDAIGELECVAAVTDSDSVTTLVTTAVNAVSIATTVESASIPTNVLNKENAIQQLPSECMPCEISPVREFSASVVRYSPTVVSEPRFELRDDGSIELPLLEREGFQLTLRGKVAGSIQQEQLTPAEDSARQSTSEVEASLPEAYASSEPRKEEEESTTEPESRRLLRGGACVELVSSDCPQLDVTDHKCAKESSDVVELDQFAADCIPREGSIVPLLDHSLSNLMTERGVDLSGNGAQSSCCFAAGDLPVGTGQVVTSCSAKSIAVDRKEGSITSPSRSSLDDVIVDNELTEEKFSSAVEDLQQTKAEGQEPDEPILKNVDVDTEDRIEVHDETKKENFNFREVHIKAYVIHTEVTEVCSKAGEMLTDAVGVQYEAKRVNLNADEVNLAVGTVQAEVHDVQVEAQLVEGTAGLDHLSLSGDGESVNADTEEKQLETEGKEMHVGAIDVRPELDWRTEVNAQQEEDAEASGTVALEVTNRNKHTTERVLELDNLDTTYTRQPPSNNLVPDYDSSVAVAGQTMSVPEVDNSRPLSSDSALHQQTGPMNELTNSEPVTLDTEKHVQVDEQGVHKQLNQQGKVQSVPLTSPLAASRCLEGDVVHPEEPSDFHMETHEKDESKTQSLRLEDPVWQRNMAGVKGSLLYKKRKSRTGMETIKDPESGVRGEDASSRVYPQKRGFLLMSTTIESGGMRIRPRPLDPDQSIPILVEGRDKEFHDYDGGSFYRWVQQQEGAKLKKPAVDPVADGVSKGGGLNIVCRSGLVKKRPIFIPIFRKLVDDKRTNGRIVTRPEQDVALGMQASYPRPQAYLRHTKAAARKLGHALGGSFCTVPSVYDMDDDDEEWLQAYNEILQHSGADQLLSENTFEQLMELFEREFYRICRINDKSLQVVPKNLGENGGTSGRRGKRLVMDSSQRHSLLEANKDGAKFSKPMEIFQGALSQKEIERRLALENRSDDCCICNGGEDSDSNPIRRCQICSINVHESCYGICAAEGNGFGHHAESPNWRCRKCEAVVGGRALPSISCAICCKSGGAMKPTVDPLKWAHVACALYTNETFFIDTEAMEPVDGLAAVETRVKKQRERCGLCGAREGSCVRCSTRGCRTPFHISCGVSQGASFELRHTKQQVEGIRSFCPHHATFVPGTNIDEIHHATGKTDDAGETLPAVSTESSDTLEMRHVERRNTGDEGNGPEDAIMNGAGWQNPFSNKTKLHRTECKTYFRKSRSGAGPRATSAGGATPSKLDPNSSPYEISEKDVHGVSRTPPESGSMLKENMQAVSQYMDESDPYVHPSDAERLESEAVSAATSASSSHLTTFENVDHAGKGTSNVDEVDPVVLADRDKAVTRDAYISDAISLKFPSLEALDTNLAPTPIVKAVYSFWQVKRVKSKGPILHELRQLQVARSQGIFNKVMHLSTDFLPPVVPDSQARMPVTRRRSVSRDPMSSKFAELRQQLEILRSIASNVVRREQVKLEDQKLIYESVQQQLLIAREVPRTRRCLWCENTQSLLNCTSCPKAFCFQCFKHRRGYGVKGWIAASKLSKYVCNFCLGSIAQERGWPELSTTFSEPRGTAISRLARVPGREDDWNHGLEVRAKPNSGKQVSFLNEACSNPYGSSSSPQEAASTMAPGRGKMIYTRRPIDVHAVHTNFAVPCTNDRTAVVDRAYHGGVTSSGLNDPAGNESRVQLDLPHVEGKKVKKRRAKVNKQVEPNTVLRATKRIKKLARSSSYVYGSEDETTISENGESRTDKKTVKLSDLRDKDGESQSTNSLEVGAEDKAEKGRPPLKFGIKFSPTGKLIVRRHGPPQHP